MSFFLSVSAQRHPSNGDQRPHLSLGNIFGAFDPFDRIADLLNGVHERSDVSSHIIEEVHSGHG